MPKQGFKNQWIEICRLGEFVEAGGKRVVIDDDFLNQSLKNFNPEQHEAPVVIGHPDMDAPAFGWTRELRRSGDRLEARFADTNDDFERMVEQGLFRKRSSAFYQDPPTLKHVGFLGAMPPAIKGLKNIHFAEGDTITFENVFNLNEEIKTKMEDKDVEKVSEGVFERIKNLFKPAETSLGVAAAKETAQFSEADVKSIVAEAVKDIKAEAVKEAEVKFAEQMTARDEMIKTLRADVDANSASGKRAEIVQFVEAIPAEKGKHFLKRAGVVEFMEACANADAANKDAEVVSFSEGEGDAKVEHKFTMLDWSKNLFSALPAFISFGESFGNIKASADADIQVDSSDLSEMRGAMGVSKTAEAGGAK